VADIVHIGLKIDAKGTEKLTQTNRSLGQLDRNVKRTGISLKQLTVAFAAAAAAGAGLAVLSKKLFVLGANAEETRNKFVEMFGDSSAAMDRFVRDFNRISGLSKQQTEDILANAAMLAQGFGYTQDAAMGFAQQVIQLGGDLGSFLNVDTARAAEAIRSALIGEREKLKALNITLMEREVIERAQLRTGKERVDQITQMDKAQASLELITERAGRALGDQARTANSNANVMRQLSAAWEDLKTKIGSFLNESPGIALFLQGARDFVRNLVVILNGQKEDIRELFEALGDMAGSAFGFGLLKALEASEPFKDINPIAKLWKRQADEALDNMLGAHSYIRTLAERVSGRDRRLPGKTLEELTGSPPPVFQPGATARAAVRELLATSTFTTGPAPTLTSGQLPRHTPGIVGPHSLMSKATPLPRAPAYSVAEMLNMQMQNAKSMALLSTDAEHAGKSLQNVAIAGMHAAANLGLMIKSGGSTGGILGGILGTAGGILSTVNPLIGAGLAAGGALLGGLTAPSNKPIPVEVSRYGVNALAQRREDEQPMNMTIVYETGGKEIKRIQKTLRRAQLRDGVMRFAS